jgi:Protein of unknown function (DUF3754)
MAEFTDREHYIPLRKSDLVQLLCKDSRLPLEEREPFRQFCRLVEATFHFEYNKQLETLKDAYAAFDPDSETKVMHPLDPDKRAVRMAETFDAFIALMERGNFRRLTRQQIQQYIDELPTSWGIDTHVNLDQFERLEVFARGDIVGTRTRRLWYRFWQLEKIQVPVFSRLVMILKLRKGAVDRSINTDALYLKIFKDVPKPDLDMLLPNARVKLSTMDRGLILYPLLAGVGLMAFNIIMSITGGLENTTIDDTVARITGKLSAALLSWSAALAVAGYGYKSYSSWQIKKQNYNLRLTRSLYYQTLDSNAGVLMRVLDEAEEQECRETYLAYYYLLKHAPSQGWTPPQLDDYVEMELERTTGLKVDFEIGDALAKLERLRIVRRQGDHYLAVPLEKALEALDWQWDNYFKYANPEPEEAPTV